jgi:MoxR-like ATPase
MDYPLAEEEIKILLDLHNRKNINDLNLIQPVFTKEKLKQIREKVRAAHLDEKVAAYITQIVNSTRNNSDLYLGGSPRASISIMIGAKAMAAINGRDFVTPDDVKMVVYPTLRHRILLTPEKEMEGKTPDDIIKTILERVEVPR